LVSGRKQREAKSLDARLDQVQSFRISPDIQRHQIEHSRKDSSFQIYSRSPFILSGEPLTTYYLCAYLVASGFPILELINSAGITASNFNETDELIKFVKKYRADHSVVSPIAQNKPSVGFEETWVATKLFSSWKTKPTCTKRP
jgi:hypothetical protein